MVRLFTRVPNLRITRIPNLQLGNAILEALASRLTKLELRLLGFQAGAWEPARNVIVIFVVQPFFLRPP